MTRYFDDTHNLTIAYDQEMRPYHRVIAGLLPTEPTFSLLDIGCGVGNTLVEARRRGRSPRATVADIDPECLRITGERVEVERSILLETPDDIYDVEGPFDVVLHSHVLQYDPDPARLVRHLLSLLAPAGILIIAIPNLVTPARLAAYSRNRAQTEGSYYWDRRSFTRFLTDVAGATLVETRGDYVPLPGESRFRFLTGLGVRLTRRFPQLTFSTICVVTR